MIQVAPELPTAYQLLHEGTLALCKVERNGMRVDIDYCNTQFHRLGRKVELAKKRVMKSEEIRNWYRANPGKTFNVDSGVQLADALFKYSNHKPSKETETGKPSTDEEALKNLKLPLVDDILLVRKLSKARNTYIGGFIREEVSGWLHPFFNLHLVITYRSSSSAPNFQNQPVRIEEIKRLVRRAIIPRPGHMIVEIDYSQVEIRGATCYHQDPAMIDEIINPERDMHRDMAMECYMLAMNEWTSMTRYCGKNMFIFPQFYGDWWKTCAERLWTAISTLNLVTTSGIPLKKHLRSKGIKTLRQFEKHIERVEKHFWGKRFKVYSKWKDDHVDQYHETGMIHLLTGFTCKGLMDRNDVINYPVQGIAFHWLLWSLTRLQDWLDMMGFRTKIIGQIHDSIVLDAHPEELDTVLAMARQIMTIDIRKHWPWIIVPLAVDFEATPVDKSWYYKDEIIKGPECKKCNNDWLYKKEDEDEVQWTCPMCENVSLVPF